MAPLPSPTLLSISCCLVVPVTVSVVQEAKLKAKKSAVWQDRLAKQGEQQQAKQAKRQGNIDSRIQARKDKKKQKVGVVRV